MSPSLLTRVIPSENTIQSRQYEGQIQLENDSRPDQEEMAPSNVYEIFQAQKDVDPQPQSHHCVDTCPKPSNRTTIWREILRPVLLSSSQSAVIMGSDSSHDRLEALHLQHSRLLIATPTKVSPVPRRV
jgi:hypothetical protein